MNDKDWLSKVKLALAVYKQTEFCCDPDEVEDFVRWLYSQYGIVYEK